MVAVCGWSPARWRSAFAELVLHALIDLGKGEEKFGLVTDQLLHVACKLAYALLLGYGVVAA